MKVSYLRVSTEMQEVGRQEHQLDKLGIKFKKAYVDKMSGKNTDRPQLQLMKQQLKKGDTVYCESISRLGRNLKDLIEIVEYFTEKGIRVIILKEGIDTDSSTYKLLLGIFGAIAEMEREQIVERTKQSIERLKYLRDVTGEIDTRSGKWFGQPQKQIEDLPKDFTKYYRKMYNKEITKVEMAKLLGVGRATLYRWIKLYEAPTEEKEAAKEAGKNITWGDKYLKKTKK